MKILIIDGQGGKIGKQLVNAVNEHFLEHTIMVVGTNSVATAAMLKGTSLKGATGENAVMVCARRADVIVCPIGIVIADSMMGEISPAMAAAVGQSDAVKILLPLNCCNNLIAGINGVSVSELIEDSMNKISNLLKV